MKKLFALCALALCCVWALSGCKDSDSEPTPNPPVVETPGFQFELVSKTSGSITVRVTPENFEGNYYWAAIDESTLNDRYNNNPAAAASDVVTMLKSQYGDYGYNSFEEFYASQISSGSETNTFDGYMAQTKVYCLAFGLDEAGVITTDVVLSEAFTTDAVAPSSNTFQISFEGTSVSVTPSNNDPYTFYLFPKSTVDAYDSLDALAEAFITQNKAMMSLLTYTGSQTKDFFEVFFENGAGEYVAFAFGYESGCITTDVASETFEYVVADPSVGDPFSDLTGDVSVDCIDAYYEKALGGNKFSENASTYFLALQAESSYYYPETRLALYLQKESDAVFPDDMAGTYKINASLAPESIVKGWKDAEGNHGSIYYEKDAYVPNASIDSGTVTIVDNGNGTYTVTVDAKDMNGHAIRANYTGAISEYVEEW